LAKITIVGTGLIGTSLGLALRQSDLRNLELVGTDYDSGARSGAQKRGAFDKMENRLLTAVEGADVVVLATPIIAMRDLMETIGRGLSDNAVITDVGSSKKAVVEWAAEVLPDRTKFVGGHPMAGRETSGPEYAAADLFLGKPYCIVPNPDARQQAVSAVTTMAEAIGAKPFFISADEHDSFVAAVSHLPFVMSVALMQTVSKSANWDDIAQLASSGFRDLSRLASGDAVMHRDISITNREPIVSWIDSFIRELYEIRNLLKDDSAPDSTAIEELFDHAHEERDRWLAGLVTPGSHAQRNPPDIPTFSESMGEMFLGSKGMEAQRRIFGNEKDKGRDKRRRK
jgi:prephenate dehydrogenase